MYAKLEKFGLAVILAPVMPLTSLLAAWFGAYSLLLPEHWVAFAALTGLLFGIAADIFLLKRLIIQAHRLSMAFWLAIFLFYTIGVFGLFMGVPVFNAALAIPAGFVVGGKLAAENANRLQVRKAARRAAWFTTGVLALICAASAFIALVSPSTPNDLRGMFALSSEITQGMIIGLIAIGGLILLTVSWGLTIFSVRFTHRFFQNRV